MGRPLGFDVSRILVHAGAPAAAAPRDLRAVAFASGRHIVLGDTWHARPPEQRERTLRHELTHVAQAGAIDTPPTHVLPDAHALERQAALGASPSLARAPAGAVMRQPLIMGPFARKPPTREDYEAAKQKLYKAAIQGLHAARKASVEALRKAAEATLTDPVKGLMLSVIDGMDVVMEFLIQIPLYVLGLAVGFGEGIYGLVTGLVTLIYGILKWFVLLLYGFIDKGEQFNKYSAEIIKGVRAIPDGLRKVWSDWKERFEKASPDETSILIGELVGQILAVIASFGVAASKAGQIPKLTVEVGGLGVMRGGVATAEAVTIDFASQAKTVASLAEIGANMARVGDGGGPQGPGAQGPAPKSDTEPGKRATPEERHAASPEAELGLSAKQVKGLRDLLAKRLDEAPGNLGEAWTKATNAADLKIVKANTNMSKGARAQIRGYFDKQRVRFWRAVLKEGTPSAERFKSLGFKWGNPGTAPYLELSNGKVIKLDIDHIIEIREATATALDAHNLRLAPARENRTVLRLLHDLDPFQKPP
jgi:hypothetical protein